MVARPRGAYHAWSNKDSHSGRVLYLKVGNDPDIIDSSRAIIFPQVALRGEFMGGEAFNLCATILYEEDGSLMPSISRVFKRLGNGARPELTVARCIEEASLAVRSFSLPAAWQSLTRGDSL